MSIYRVDTIYVWHAERAKAILGNESVFVKQVHAGRIIESAISEGFVHDVELAHR